MRILLVNPPYPVCESLTMPLGLLYLAGQLERAGHEVALADMQLCRAPMRRLKPILHRFRPQVAGITSFSINCDAASRILRSIKRCLPEAFTVWGGAHASFDDLRIIQDQPWVDAVVRGEGEETMEAVVSRLTGGKDLRGVLGVSWRGPGGEPLRNPPRPFRGDLDGLPRPAYHLIPLSKYRAFGDGASLITSRGCPHRCLFCVGRRMIGAKVRFRSPTAVVDEMEALVSLGFSRIRVEDDLFTFRKDRALAICREMRRRGLSVRWRAYARVDTVDPQLLEWMANTGCERLMFGAESGNREILRRIRKGITPRQIRRAIHMTRAAGIGVLASFVLGLPGETPETLRETLDFAESLGVPYSLNLLTPYAGTELREQASRWGIQILSDDWRLYGQGRPLTATQEVRPWHLSRAMETYKKRLRTYVQGLLEQEDRGILNPQASEDLERHRRWDFLRQLIREDTLEQHRGVPSVLEDRGMQGLVESLAKAMGRPADDVGRFLPPLLQDGYIHPAKAPAGGFGWVWAPNHVPLAAPLTSHRAP